MSGEVINLVAQDETAAKEKTERKQTYKERKAFRKALKKAKADPFPDEVEVSKASLERHTTGAVKLNPMKMKTKLHQRKFEVRKKNIESGIEKTARAEILNVEDAGFLELEEGESCVNIRQSDIVANVDVASATKHFELRLPQFGPYRVDYSSNGRYLAIAGRKGHVAAFDWQTKRLLFETNVMEAVRDVQFLHTETMMAVAQKNYTYVYDNTGTELHCVKSMHAAERLQFLPKHFLLVASTRKSWLHWLDVSVGQMVTSTLTRNGVLDCMTQNTANAIIHTGHSDGTVSLWSPNVKEPLVRLLAHYSSLRGIAVDNEGTYMYTTGVDRKLRVWDLRMFRPLHSYILPFGLGEVDVSQRRLVACGVGNTLQVFNDMHVGVTHEPSLIHRVSSNVSNLSFVPFEDVLGVGHAEGFSSMLVPGSGEPNVDALRCNPYETKKQRREREVKQLLDKISPDLISLDPNDINRVNTSALEEEEEKRKSILWLKESKVEFTPRHKMKGRGGGVNKAKTKASVQAQARLKSNMEKRQMEREVFGKETEDGESKKGVLDRFKKN